MTLFALLFLSQLQKAEPVQSQPQIQKSSPVQKSDLASHTRSRFRLRGKLKICSRNGCG